MNDININEWIESFKEKIIDAFGERVKFIGLQGSRGRNEERKDSDIDVVVILDTLKTKDLDKYEKTINKMENRNLICGFISGIEEIKNWDKSDLFQFYYDTSPVYKNIDFIKSTIKKNDIKRMIHLGACNIYHMAVHNYIHEKNIEILKSLYKSLSFIIKAKYFYENSKYIKQNKELANCISNTDKEIFDIYLNFDNNIDKNNKYFKDYSEMIINYTSTIIKNYSM